MHDAFYVEATSGDQITEIASEIQKIEGVAEVNYGGQSTVSMVDTMAMVRKIGGFLVIDSVSHFPDSEYNQVNDFCT